jgi:8-oxo-dGTP pyrophosphatase MutT (NUDIX family)
MDFSFESDVFHIERIRKLIEYNDHPESCGDMLKKAAVFLLLCQLDSRPSVKAILKSNNKGYPWANQVALPGGMIDPKDPTSHDAALREVEEELNIRRDTVESFGSMGHFQTINRTEIEVFAGAWDETGTIRHDPGEIAEVLTIPVDELLEIHQDRKFGGRIPDYSELMYPVGNVVVWGATARIFHYFLELVYPSEYSRSNLSIA